MKKVNSLSGGKTSSYMAVNYPADYEIFSCVCLDDTGCKPKDKAVSDYANNKLSNFSGEFGEFIATAEDDATLTAMMDLEQFIGREIIWVRGKSFDSVINERHERVLLGNRKRLPSWARRFCTEEMKLLPIFLWWFKEIGEKCEMRIGFRFDEFDRMLSFFNNSDPCNFKIPIACKTYGEKRMVHETYKWRSCAFPLVKEGITKSGVDKFWDSSGIIKGDLFRAERKIVFPVVSNCVGCFHKKEETLAAMSMIHPEKMNWFAQQEKLGMGTWLDSRKTYEEIIANNKEIAKEVHFEITKYGHSCDSGGCTG